VFTAKKKNYFAWKSSDAVREASNDAYPDIEVLNETVLMLCVSLHVKKR
jgi:hypothetical protein